MDDRYYIAMRPELKAFLLLLPEKISVHDIGGGFAILEAKTKTGSIVQRYIEVGAHLEIWQEACADVIESADKLV